MQRVMSLKLNDEEASLLAARAKELDLYPHGVVRAAVRLVLGLPIASRLERELREPQHDPTLTR